MMCGISALVVRDTVVPDYVALPLAAADAHNCVDGGDAKKALSCVRRERISSWSSVFWSLRLAVSI